MTETSNYIWNVETLTPEIFSCTELFQNIIVKPIQKNWFGGLTLIFWYFEKKNYKNYLSEPNEKHQCWKLVLPHLNRQNILENLLISLFFFIWWLQMAFIAIWYMFIDLCIQNIQCTSLFALYYSHIRELEDQLPSVVYSSTAHGMIPDLFNVSEMSE